MSQSAERKSSFVLPSPQTGTDYSVQVVAPEAAREPGPWPAIAFMDGDDQFKYAAAAYRVARTAGEVPPLLLVGVGYGASYAKPGNRRLRDYTPTAMATEAESGGADAFVAFLADTLWPELARRHPLSDDRRGLAGHSLGSLLVLHALFQRQPRFNRFLASAPSLWWDERSLLRLAAARRDSTGELPARLFLGIGMEDTPSMTGDLALFEAQLAARPFAALEIVSRRFAGRDHYNVLPTAFREGLGALFV
jgi:predicted alpha/beta superfamily hydrolase